MARKTTTDRTSIYGIIISFIIIIVAIYSGGSILPYIDIASILIVIGGTTCITCACFNFTLVKQAMSLSKNALKRKNVNFHAEALKSMRLVDTAYRKGVLALQQYKKNDIGNDFLYDAIHANIDNISPEVMVNYLKNKIDIIEERYVQAIEVFKKAAEISPAMGLIGTLIGLVRMLGNLSDINMIGPAMAVALLTTFYGAIISYLICFPIAVKLEHHLSEELQLYEVYTQTALAINRKDHPRHVEVQLNSILPAKHQIRFYQ